MGKLFETFRNRLEERLRPHGATAEFVKLAKVSRKTVEHWVAGRRVPDLNQIEEIARGLGRPPIDLIFPGELPKAAAPSPSQALEILRDAIALTHEESELLRRFRLLKSDALRASYLDTLRTATAGKSEDACGTPTAEGGSGALPRKPHFRR